MAFIPVRVTAVRELAQDAAELEFEAVDAAAHSAQLADRLAGQHVAVRCPGLGEERRTYSITTAPSDALRIGVRRIPGGLVSSHLVDEVQAGDVLEVLPPAGRFVLQPSVSTQAARHFLLVAAGSGITPILSIARAVLADEPGSCVTLLFANRAVGSMMFREELDALKSSYFGRFAVHHFLTRERRDLELFDGRLDAPRLRRVWAALIGDRGADVAYLCGPEQLTEVAREVLIECGMAADQVHVELFETEGAVRLDPARLEALRAASLENADVDASLVTIRMNGIETAIRVPEGATVLEGALAAGLAVPYACAGGVCATCRAHVDDGQVSMRTNQALEHDEVEAGFVLTCQSLVGSQAARIDFDRR